MSTGWDAEADESKVRVALPDGVPRLTVTVSVTLCPAARLPAVLLRLTSFGAELPADQLTGPSIAVRVIWPVVPVPTPTLSAETCSVPGDAGVPDLAGLADWPAALLRMAGAWAGGSGWVAAVISTWLRPPAVLTSGGGVGSWARDNRAAASLPDETGPGFAEPRDAGPACGTVPVGVAAAMSGVTSRNATGGRDDPARAKAEVMTTAEATAPSPATTRLVQRPRRDRGPEGRAGGEDRAGRAGGEDRAGRAGGED